MLGTQVPLIFHNILASSILAVWLAAKLTGGLDEG